MKMVLNYILMNSKQKLINKIDTITNGGSVKKGISFYFGYKINYKERARMIKDAGFDCVITNADKNLNKQNGSIRKQIKEFKKVGLSLSSLHMRYDSSELNNFFKDNKIGDKLEKILIKDVKIAKKYGFSCVVVHLKEEFSFIGVERLKRILNVCEKLDIPLAIENIDYRDVFVKVFENIDNKYLKFCYDSGHNNFIDSYFDYLGKYGEKLVCLHLHDNDGTDDQHTLNKYGNIDWEEVAKKLAKCNEVNLDYELLMNVKGKTTEKEALEECYKQACELEKMILKYKDL